MTALLRSDIYRFKRQKINMVLLIIYFALTAMGMIGNGFMTGNAPWLLRLYDAMRSSGEMGEMIPIDELRNAALILSGDITTRVDFMSYAMTGTNALLFTTLFIALYILQPVRTQYLKNLVPVQMRNRFVISETIFLFGFTAILTVFSAVFALLVSFTFFTGIPFGDAVLFLVFAVVRGLLLFSAALVLTLFVNLFRRTGLGVAFTIIYVTVIASGFFAAVDLIMDLSGNQSFRFSYLTPVGNYYTLDRPEVIPLMIGLGVAVLYGIAAFILRLLQFKKKDIG
ncbi:MAG: hypothetical protein IJM76_07025 [Lachnospiraceae bacterium]|nr:hypothetical protein [Lachnospiraceae bacterium]